MPSLRRIVLGVLAALAGVVVLVVAAWLVDAQRHDGRVVRNVRLAGRSVGGMTRTELGAVVDDLVRRYGEAPVSVDAPGSGFSLVPAEIGLRVERDQTVAAVMEVGRRGSAPSRVAGWVAAFFADRRSTVRVAVDENAVYRLVAARDRGRVPPREPSIRPVGKRLVEVAGKPGRGVDPAEVIANLPVAAGDGLPVTVPVGRGRVPPRFPVSEATRLVREGEAATARPLEVELEGERASIGAAHLRSWLRSEATDAGLRLAVDAARAGADLRTLLPDAGTPPVETTFTLVGDAPQIVPGRAGTACCADDAGPRLQAALLARVEGRIGEEPVSLPLHRVEPELTPEEAAGLGVREPVATFTTAHKPGQPRVRNIHRIADLVRGQVIAPGRTFSVNGFVGNRTADKGFVVDAVIEDGKFTEAVGGGVSQFATTTFNAAFFAGMEFAEYQSHSIYISRYPFGREATLSFPHPDLKIRNPSPYGVLIWPTYTDRTITVTLYSTRWVEVAQTNQTTQPKGPCTRVRTERTRRFLADGTTKVDHISALYRPEEGVNCT